MRGGIGLEERKRKKEKEERKKEEKKKEEKRRRRYQNWASKFSVHLGYNYSYFHGIKSLY